MTTPTSGPPSHVLGIENGSGRLVGEVASADGVAVRYEVHGGGTPAVVFIHGWSCDRRYWQRQVGHFAARFTVVTIDLAGHGESGTGRQSWTMPAFGEDVVAVVTELNLPDMVLVGHSMGGDVVVEAARRLPERVRGLVWVDTYRSLTESDSDAAVEEETAAFMAPFRAGFVAATRAFVRRIFGPGADPGLVDCPARHGRDVPTGRWTLRDAGRPRRVQPASRQRDRGARGTAGRRPLTGSMHPSRYFAAAVVTAGVTWLRRYGRTRPVSAAPSASAPATASTGTYPSLNAWAVR